MKFGLLFLPIAIILGGCLSVAKIDKQLNDVDARIETNASAQIEQAAAAAQATQQILQSDPAPSKYTHAAMLTNDYVIQALPKPMTKYVVHWKEIANNLVSDTVELNLKAQKDLEHAYILLTDLQLENEALQKERDALQEAITAQLLKDSEAAKQKAADEAAKSKLGAVIVKTCTIFGCIGILATCLCFYTQNPRMGLFAGIATVCLFGAAYTAAFFQQHPVIFGLLITVAVVISAGVAFLKYGYNVRTVQELQEKTFPVKVQ